MKFPMTVKAFTDCQEAAAGRKLDTGERKILRAWTPLINLSYQDGKLEDTAALKESLSRLEQYQGANGIGVQRVLSGAAYWMKKAWYQGYAETKQMAAPKKERQEYRSLITRLSRTT